MPLDILLKPCLQPSNMAVLVKVLGFPRSVGPRRHLGLLLAALCLMWSKLEGQLQQEQHLKAELQQLRMENLLQCAACSVDSSASLAVLSSRTTSSPQM